jgi:hypothetical protein
MDDKAKIDQAIAELGDGRGAMLAAVRKAFSPPRLTSSRNGSGWAARPGCATA